MNEDKLDLIIGKLNTIEQNVSEIQQHVKMLKQDVSVLKQDVSVLKQDVRVLKQDVRVLKQDVSVLQQDVSGLQLEMKGVHKRLDDHENLIVQLIGIVKNTNEKVTEIAERLEAQERNQELSITVVVREQFQMKKDIEMLKNRA